jgi:hypothetical protein
MGIDGNDPSYVCFKPPKNLASFITAIRAAVGLYVEVSFWIMHLVAVLIALLLFCTPASEAAAELTEARR